MCEKLAVKTPSTTELAEAVRDLVPEIPLDGDFGIASQEDLDLASELLHAVKEKLKLLESRRKSMTDPLDVIRTNIVNYFRPTEHRLKQQEVSLKRAIADYQREVENVRRAEEARLRDLHALEQRKLAERAEKLRQAGKEEQAEAVIARLPPTPVVLPDYDRPAGISTREQWAAEVVDFAALAHYALAMGRLDLLQADMPRLNELARTTKGTMMPPGVNAVRKDVVVVR